ncbi:MAG TPA: hypothetical protein PKZ57_04895, partial [Methanoregulaceae archaeon]|nr:hypothetical protein [Methanoregulaceae archaeon]
YPGHHPPVDHEGLVNSGICGDSYPGEKPFQEIARATPNGLLPGPSPLVPVSPPSDPKPLHGIRRVA